VEALNRLGREEEEEEEERHPDESPYLY